MVKQYITHDGSMVLVYMVTWIPSIYPSHVSIYIYIPAPWILWVINHPPVITIFIASRSGPEKTMRL